MPTRMDIQNSIQMYLNNPTYYSTLDMNDSIQDGVDEICAFTGCVYASATISFTANKSYYDLLTLLPNYIGVIAIFNNAIKRWLIPTSLRKLDQDRIDWETALGVPYYFVPVSHRYMAIYKKPGAVGYGNMFIFYRAAAPTLDDTTNIPIPDDHLTAVENYCLTDLWEQNQEFTKGQESLKNYISDLESLRVYMRSKRMPDRLPSLK